MQRDMAALRRAVPWTQWDAAGAAIARSRGQMRANPREEVTDLRDRGYLGLGKSSIDTSAIVQFFQNEKGHEGHHPFTQNPYFMGYRTDQVLRAPGLLDLFNSSTVLEPVHDYLECIPTLYSVNAWWSLPAPSPQVGHVQHWHRDSDDWRFLCLFVYLTDVDDDCGPHEVMPGSHLGDPPTIEDAPRHALCGPAGSMFLVNTMCLHRGIVPQKPRLMAWARYGLGPNTNSYDLEGGPIASHLLPTKMKGSPVERYVNRLLVNFDGGPI